MAPGPDKVYVRIRLGMVSILDVEQQFRPDVNVLFYFTPRESIKIAKREGVRFENMPEPPKWQPHFDFNNEVAEPIVTDVSYWYDSENNVVFGRYNILPLIQERFDHHRFPFDRQILDIQLHSNNCTFDNWALGRGEFPVELSLKDDEWLIQCELSAMADTWDLIDVQSQIKNDVKAMSSALHIQVFLERCSAFYVWNISFVYALIIMAQTCLIVFPFNESRFEFSMQLALTTVAFKFVIEMHVPKTAYLTTLDSFMLLGLLLLGVRFLGDTVMQGVFDVPVGQEGYRGKCDETHDGFDVCSLDIVFTMCLSITWLVSSLFYLLIAPKVLRPSWNSLNRMVQNGNSKSRIEYEIMGRSRVIVSDAMLEYEDMENSVNIEDSKDMFESK